jgi:epoxyqueuosine reductase
MHQLKEDIRSTAREAWVDMIGFAGRERFRELEEDKNPFSLFPDGQTVIMIARRITRGTLRGVEEGSNFDDYSMFGKNWLAETFLPQSVFEIAKLIEKAGYEAMPLVPEKPMPVSRVAKPVAPDFRYAAVACGMGEIGLSGEVLTPRFGPRQRFAMIITDAQLPGDPIYERLICTHCGRCITVCPLHAMDSQNIERVTICGKTMSVAACDFTLCDSCQNGATHDRNGVDRLAALCMRTCVHELEKSGALDQHFESGFRKRHAWSKNELGEPVDMSKGDQV